MLYLASDHGGFSVKEKVKELLNREGVAFKDFGPQANHPDDDYPDFVLPMAEMVAHTDSKGIISCRNGQGAAIAANKVPKIRAAVCWDEECARTSRTDDNANVLSLPADFLTDDQVESIVLAWLNTPYSYDSRHNRRLDKVHQYETTHQTTMR